MAQTQQTVKKEDVKKKRPVPANQKPKISVREYFRGIKTEMKKVIWPTRKEMGSYTVVVLVTCLFFGLAFWALDSAFLFALKGILGISFN